MTMFHNWKALRGGLNAIALPAVATLGVCLLAAAGSFAQTYPNRLIKLVERLNSEINASLATSQMKTRLMKVGVERKIGSPQEFASLIVDEIETWKAAPKSAGIVPE